MERGDMVVKSLRANRSDRLAVPRRLGLRSTLLGAIGMLAGCAASQQPQASATLGPPPVTPYDVAPELINPSTVGRTMERLYREEWRNAGIEGCTLVWVHVGSEGTILESRLKTTSRSRELDSAALEVIRVMRFQPAVRAGVATAAWFDIPVVFSMGGVPPCEAERPIK
jgi:TonB family protein